MKTIKNLFVFILPVFGDHYIYLFMLSEEKNKALCINHTYTYTSSLAKVCGRSPKTVVPKLFWFAATFYTQA